MRPIYEAKLRRVPRLRNSSPKAAELLAKLVAFDTTSARSNLPLIGFVQAYLEDQGVEATTDPLR